MFLAYFLGLLLREISPQLLYFSVGLHQTCLEHSPSGRYQDLYQALVCGQKIQNPNLSQLLKQAGMIHIFVVSGAHLLLLKATLQKLFNNRLPAFIEVTLTGVYTAMCGLHTPVLRAWFKSLLTPISLRLQLNNSHQANLILSLILCLMMRPQEVHSYSLLMSWIASLSISLGRNSFSQSCYCYLFLLPVVGQFSSLSPWTILINAFITPLIALVLFPLAALCFLFPPLAGMGDLCWQSLEWVLQTLENSLSPPLWQTPKIHVSHLWIYACTLQTLRLCHKQ